MTDYRLGGWVRNDQDFDDIIFEWPLNKMSLDLGWNDVGFHGSNQIPTPNIDALAYSGIILQNYYVNQACSPSRSALMTGRHPIHTGRRSSVQSRSRCLSSGLQDNVLVGAAPYSLSPTLTILPQHLNSRGYQSHAVGKAGQQ